MTNLIVYIKNEVGVDSSCCAKSGGLGGSAKKLQILPYSVCVCRCIGLYGSLTTSPSRPLRYDDPEASSTVRALDRALVSVIITLLNDSERSLNKKMAAPSNKQIKSPQMVGNLSKTPFYLQFKLFHFIYPHKETYIVIPKVESDNIAFIVPHENPLLFWYCFGSHL